MSASPRRAVTSFIISAPASSALWPPSCLVGVYADQGLGFFPSGPYHRQHPPHFFFKGGGPSLPGRVDSPPTSRMSAPSSASRTPWATAFSGLEKNAAVAERIRGDVYHPHDEGAPAQLKLGGRPPAKGGPYSSRPSPWERLRGFRSLPVPGPASTPRGAWAGAAGASRFLRGQRAPALDRRLQLLAVQGLVFQEQLGQGRSRVSRFSLKDGQGLLVGLAPPVGGPPLSMAWAVCSEKSRWVESSRPRNICSSFLPKVRGPMVPRSCPTRRPSCGPSRWPARCRCPRRW